MWNESKMEIRNTVDLESTMRRSNTASEFPKRNRKSGAEAILKEKWPNIFQNMNFYT